MVYEGVGVGLARQYAAKFSGNLASLAAGLATLALVPRTLGPEAFGRYEFLVDFFRQATNFLDMGTSTCFFTRLSQRPLDRGLVFFYACFMLLVTALIVGATIVLAGLPFGAWLWANQPPELIALAAGISCLIWWQMVSRQVLDAWRITVRAEIRLAIFRMLAVAVLAGIIAWFGLTLEGYFAYQLVTFALSVGLLWLLMLQARPALQPLRSGPSAKQYAREFFDYSHPLLVYAFVNVIAGIAERWILQTQAGAAQQGFYGFAFQVGAVCALFTTAMTPLLMREMAVAWNDENIERMQALFRRIAPLLYALAAYFSVFVAFKSDDVAWLIAGARFEEGAPAVAAMVLYPMHQTYGQITGSILLATNHTKQYRNIGLVGILAGVPFMLWLIAPAASGGLGLGSLGLALKVVILNIVMVNVQLWIAIKLLKLRFSRYLLHQLAVPVCFSVCALIGVQAANMLALGRFPGLIICGMIYSLLVITAIAAVPQLAGMQRGELGAAIRKVIRKSNQAA